MSLVNKILDPLTKEFPFNIAAARGEAGADCTASFQAFPVCKLTLTLTLKMFMFKDFVFMLKS